MFIPSPHDYNTYDMHKKMRQAVMFEPTVCLTKLFSTPPMIQAPRFFGHVVAAVIIGRSGPAAAAHALVTASTAAAAILQRPQFFKHFTVTPDFIKRRVMHVAQFHIQIRTGLNLAARTDDTIAQTGQTATVESRLYPQLVSNAQELRCTGWF